MSSGVIAAVLAMAGAAFTGVSLAQQRLETAPPRAFRGAMFEASGVVGVPGTDGVLMVDDGRPRHVLWVQLSPDGTQVGDVTEVPIHADVPDLEDITSDGEYFYVVGSQSQGGGQTTAGLVRFRFHPKSLTTTHVEQATGLKQMLVAAVPELQGGRGRGLPLNIEGLMWDPVRAHLLLGLRSPTAGGQALVIALRLRDSSRPLTTDNLTLDGPPIRLPLGGDGIRGLGYDSARQTCLLIAGASSYGHPVDFQIFEWDGATAASLREIAAFPASQKPEGITRMTLGGRRRTVVVFDIGGYRVMD
jgi:hypothetical protein